MQDSFFERWTGKKAIEQHLRKAADNEVKYLLPRHRHEIRQGQQKI